MNMIHSAPSSQRPRPGYLLLLVLAFLFLTSVVVVALLESSMRNLRSAAAASARDDLRVSAFSAMEIALATLAEINELDDALNGPNQGWGDPASYAPIQWPEGMEVNITIQDETGKLPLDPPDRDTLRQLFEQMGIGYGEADELIDAYLDWVDEDDLERLNGAEEDYYRTQDPERKPPNAPITSYEAFRYIKGFDEWFFDENGAPNVFFQQFKESTSLKHGHPVNVNTASATLRGMLEESSGLDVRRLEDIELGLDREAGTHDDGVIDRQTAEEINMPSGLGYEAHVFRITVKVVQGQQRFQLTALVDDGSSSSESGEGNSSNPGSGDNRNLAGGGGADDNGDDDRRNDEPQREEGEGEEQSQSGGDDARVIYTNGDWRFLELTENGSEDG